MPALPRLRPKLGRAETAFAVRWRQIKLQRALLATGRPREQRPVFRTRSAQDCSVAFQQRRVPHQIPWSSGFALTRESTVACSRRPVKQLFRSDARAQQQPRCTAPLCAALVQQQKHGSQTHASGQAQGGRVSILRPTCSRRAKMGVPGN
jgi:hypothetical protein